MALITSDRNRKAQRGIGIDDKLSGAFKDINSGKRIKAIPIERIEPNTENSRKIRIPLDDLKEALKIGQDDCLVTIDEEGKMNFPDYKTLKKIKPELITGPKEIDFYENIRYLAISIFNHKEVISPVEVRSMKDGSSYKLNIGHRRLYASDLISSFLPSVNINSTIRDGEDLDEAIRRFDENNKKHDLDILEELNDIKVIVKLIEKEKGEKVSQAQLCKILGMSRPAVSFFFRIMDTKLSSEEIGMIDDYGLNDLRTISEICKLEDEEARIKALCVYVEKGSVAARKHVKLKLSKEEDQRIDDKKRLMRPNTIKFTPTLKAVNSMVSIFKNAAPELIEGMEDTVQDPVEILDFILKKLESTGS